MTGKKFHKHTAKRPHINGRAIFNSQHNLRRSVVSALYIVIDLLTIKTSTSKINYLDPNFILSSYHNILRLDITVDDLSFLQKVEALQYLDSKSMDK